ncbi:MAG: hypothetical protein HZA54_19730, partial [Planctomycetes bacterium]|nr:hypothetical protein [Planctomycetota bacterium]
MPLTDFFLASDAEFAEVFRGWKRKPPDGDATEGGTVEEDDAGEFAGAPGGGDPLPVVDDPDAESAPDIHRLPWIDQKGMDVSELAELMQAVLGWSFEAALIQIEGRILIGPDEASEQVYLEVPSAL